VRKSKKDKKNKKCCWKVQSLFAFIIQY
jgi:hypothetical protein